MKKFNVKALSLAVAAAVVSGTASAEEVNLVEKVRQDLQGVAAFQSVFGEGTTYNKDTEKLTFKNGSEALLLKTMELEQAVNGFASGKDFIATNEDGSKTIRKATNEDIEADSLKGVGLAGGLTAVNTRVDNLAKDIDDALDDQDETIEELKTAITTNGTRIAEVATGVNDLNKSVTEMGKDISTKFNEVDSEISKASSELSESIDKVNEDVTAVNTRVDSLAQDAADAKATAKAAEDKVTELSANVDGKVKEAKDAAKAAEDKVTELSANIDSKVKEAKDAAANAVDAASKIDAVADKADKASKGVAGLTEALEKVAEQSALAAAENAQALNGFKENDEIVVTDDDGIKSVKKATKEDVEKDEFGGLGLKEVAAKHDQSLADLTAETERAKKAAEQAALAAIENAQELNGFKVGDEIVVTGDDDSKSTKEATQADVDADGFGGLGLKEVVAEHDKALGELTETVNDNSEALVKTAEVVNAISADVNANKAAIETKADKADFEELAKYTDNMGKKVNDIGDEVTALSDATSAAITRHDKEIVDLAQAGLKATEALDANRNDIDANKQGIVDLAKGLGLAAEAVEDNRKEIDANKAAIAANKAAIAENTASLKEQEEANEGFNNAISSLDEDISTLKKVSLAAADALEVNRQDIDANKAAIETKADKADFEELAKYTDNMGKKVNDIGDEVTALSDATSAAIARHDKDIVDLAQAGLKATEALEANRKDIDANKKDIGDLALAGKAAMDALEVNRQDIDANKAAIAENTAALEEQEKANEGFNNAITSLDKDIGDLALAGKAAMEALEVNRQDIDANKAAIDKKADKADIETAKKAAVEAEKSAKSVQGSVEVAQKSAETAESHAKDAQASAVTANNVASAAQTAAAQAQDAVKANATQVATNKADIATLQTASNQHAAGIAKNSARIDSLDKNVANLRKETRQGLAAQAALSGLFQPYSVGKFNVTAALGGFKSDTAVAVGAGYRFNENFAAKAGLAVGTSSGGSASYNVGVNYEW